MPSGEFIGSHDQYWNAGNVFSLWKKITVETKSGGSDGLILRNIAQSEHGQNVLWGEVAAAARRGGHRNVIVLLFCAAPQLLAFSQKYSDK